ncbi:MAG: DUF4124 domain-containing protein [Acidovorax sp.]
MSSRSDSSVFTVIAVALVAAAVAWWTADQWLPQVAPWAEQAWKKVTRPGPDTLPPGKKPEARPAQGAASEPVAPQPRKCVKDGRTTYTDQTCPPGSQELPVDGNVTSLPPSQ